MLDVIGFNTKVVQGNFFTSVLRRRFRRSGLSVQFAPGRVGAVGLDFNEEASLEYVDWWSFVLKIINPSSEAIVIEKIEFCWKGRRGFLAESISTGIKPIYPKSKLPDEGDTYLPRLIYPQSEELTEVNGYMRLYSKWLWVKRPKIYNVQSYGEQNKANSKLKILVSIKTDRGLTKLKA